MTNWKTTAAGALSAFGMAVGPLSGFLAAMQTIAAQQPGHAPANYTLAICGAGLTTLAAIARAWVGLLQNDAVTPAQIGGIAVNAVNTGVAPINPEKQ